MRTGRRHDPALGPGAARLELAELARLREPLRHHREAERIEAGGFHCFNVDREGMRAAPLDRDR